MTTFPDEKMKQSAWASGLLSLARDNVPPEVQDLLVYGEPEREVAPKAWQDACEVALTAALADFKSRTGIDVADVVAKLQAGAHVVMERDKLDRLLSAAKLLQATSEGCAANHYSQDYAEQGLPGFLIDTHNDIQQADAMIRAATSGNG